MKMAIGGTLMTIGCLMLLCALLAIALSLAPFEEIGLPGGGGLPALIAAALIGWGTLTILLGCGFLRRVPRSTVGQVPVLVTAILGTLVGVSAYFFYELQLPRSSKPPDADADEVTLHVRGFGTTFDVAGGSRVEWTRSKGVRRRSTSEGADAKALLLVAGIGTFYAFVGGTLPAGLVARLRRAKPPADVADYGELVTPIRPVAHPKDG